MEIPLKPREYQKKILEVCINNNTLVVLPTGLGKTLIALLLSIERIKEHPGKKILFLAPTRPLADQHFQYYKKNLPELFAEMNLFTGNVEAHKRKELWNTSEIVFSTPQCIANDLRKDLYNLREVSLLIIDEAHRCLKNYDYTNVVKFYKNQSETIRILGLTASPGHEADKVRQICNHLDIEEIEVRTRDSEDVKHYLQSLDFQRIDVEFPKEFIEIRVLLKRIYDQKIEKIKSMFPNALPLNKITLLKLQANLASQIAQKNFYAMQGMSLTAQAIKISHALELLETQSLSGFRNYLLSLKRQADEKKSKAVQILVNSGEFQASLKSVDLLLEKKIEHPKIRKIAEIIEEEKFLDEKAKAIIFTQFRDTAQAIVHALNQIPNIKSSIFVGQAKKSSESGISGMSQKEQKEAVEKFKTGEINALVATSIGEEGLDIPEVSAVIFYEPIPSAIRKIQRTGRTARLAPGKLFILVTQDTRDVINHYASTAREKKMHNTLEIIKREIKNKPKTLKDYK